MNYEEQVRRELEEAAKCPADGDVNAPFGSVSRGQEATPPNYKGPAMTP